MSTPAPAFNELSKQLLIGRALERASNPVALLDRGARVIWANHAYCRHVEPWIPSKDGAPSSAAVSRVCQQLQAQMGPCYRDLWARLSTKSDSWSGSLTLEAEVPGLNPIEVIFDCILSPLPDKQGRPAYFLVLLHDVTSLHKEKRQHAHAATHDSLTGLGNRLQLTAVGLSIAKEARPYALFYMDLDGFKGVNDTYGHAVGDEVLKAFAVHLKECSRGTDIPIRLGGDEFVLVLPGLCLPEDLQLIADRILARAQTAFCSVKPELAGRVGVSIGGAACVSGNAAIETLLSIADTALYRVKRSGKNAYVLGESAC